MVNLLPEFDAFAKQLLAAGFRVWRLESSPCFLTASVDGNLGSVGLSYLGGSTRYWTVHKPNPSTGDGFHFEDAGLDAEKMRACCLCRVPNWHQKNSDSVQKWKLEDWIKMNDGLFLELSQ